MATSQITNFKDVANLTEEKRHSNSLTRLALRRLSRDYLTLIAIGVILLLALLSILAPVISDMLNVSYSQTDPINKFLPINSPGHILGTDNVGRDLLSRLLYAGQVSLTIAFSAAIFSTTIGVAIGLLAGYYHGGPFGFIDDIIMWFITTLNSIPTLMLLILIAAVLTPTVITLILVLTIISWTGTMRLVRGETLANREREYIISAKASGASPLRIMFIHILPNVFSVLITALAIEIGTLILVESALSFLGLGVRPPTPSWGNMLTGAQSYFRQGAHLSIFPGLMIVLTVLSLYLIGDGLRDAFDPHSTK
jgi:peptide/nickel transport system permease protein